ncbi:hypothetical protein [Aggregatibacter actinomycetemcomitans]|uniref:hypothetical protein n=1 Tax=Aggregatibacter actinomycetemcomitans TaxID=714 RepID=UPI0002AC0E1A|nr:hypothetical protein [Aggregatibacter actinomycetemcomitans]KOE63936.1 hypothetical protein SCC393_0311300 [Aggregatibacter actinomycetemcomitans serotype e str. SCC393]KOE67372.1 hypothetical protein A160_0201745 [Aggregatibacter actinomycetemcomitans serotype e str. A160]KYK78377.1 hypothetical protein SA2876_04380 [Aggregatibacter actinomycetemcomitans serotype e str. SA2876]
MAYQTGTAKTLNQLVTKLAEFAQQQGWVIDKTADNQLYLHNTDGYWSCYLSSDDNGFYICINTGFDNSKPAQEQPGTSRTNAYRVIDTDTTQLQNGNYVSYDFFGTKQYLHVVVQIEAEKFRHLGIGTLDKEGEYTGGQYAFGTFITDNDGHYQSSDHVYGFSPGREGKQAVVRADGVSGDTKSPWYFAPVNISDYGNLAKSDYGKYLLSLGRASMYNEQNTYHPDKLMVNFSQSKFGQVLIPCPHSLIAHGVDGVFRHLGVLPDRYECTMTGVQPRQILEIAGERWMIIPSAQYDVRNAREIERGKNNSGIQGVAYRIIE